MQKRVAEAYKDISREKPVRFQIPLNIIFHEIGGDHERLRAEGIDPDYFEAMRLRGFAKETLGMTGASLHRVYRQVEYKRCLILLEGPHSNQLAADLRDKIQERLEWLEGNYTDLCYDEMPPACPATPAP